MAKLSVSSTLAALIVVSALMAMVQPGLGQNRKVAAPPKKDRQDDAHISPPPPPAEAPSPEEEYLNSIPQDVKDFVDNCTRSVSPKCGEQIVGSLINARKVHTKCCHQLVNMGLKCHIAIVNLFSGMPDVKEAEKTIKGNSHRVFRHCVKLVKKDNKRRAKGPAPPS